MKALELMGTRIERAFLVCRDWSSSLAGAARIVHYVPLNEIHPGGVLLQRITREPLDRHQSPPVYRVLSFARCADMTSIY